MITFLAVIFIIPLALSESSVTWRRDRDIAQRHKTIEILFQGIYEYGDAERRASMSIAENVRKLALEFEEIMLQKEQPEFIPTICTLVCHRFRDNKRPWLKSNVVKVLDDKYKRFFTEESYRQSQTIIDLPEECSVEENDLIGQLQLIRDKLKLYQFSKSPVTKAASMIPNPPNDVTLAKLNYSSNPILFEHFYVSH